VPDETEALTLIVETIMTSPYNAALRMYAVETSREGVTVVLPYSAEFVGNPDNGVLHGGAITAVVDTACGMSVFLKRGSSARIATLDLRIDYLKPATPPKDVRVRGECYKVTRHVAFVRASAYHDDPSDAIAAAAGTFIIFEEQGSAMGRLGATKP
jgi:uncharacterized protein (TIGR00369 family)